VELRHLRYFVAAAEENSLGRAAERLHISAPGLSLQIKELERETGIELFERSARGIRLTRGGEAFLVEARALLSGLDAGIARARSVAHGKTGALRIGHVPSALRHSPVANRLIPEFLLRNPDVDVQAIQFTMDEQIAAIREGRLDVAIAYAPPDQDFGLRRQMLYDGLSIGLLVPSSHPVALKQPLHCRDLAELPWLTIARNLNAPLIDWFVRELRARGLDTKPSDKLQITDGAVLVEMVAAGAGWMFSSPKAAEGFASRVVYREWAEPPIRTSCCAFVRPNDASPLVDAFLALARELRRGLPDQLDAVGSLTDRGA
jgi:DNA-binding transcriptional LysR family regulator